MSTPRALVLGVSRDLGFAAGTFLAGFHQRNPEFDGDAIVLHDGLAPADRDALARITPRLQLRDYDSARAIARLTGAAPLRPAAIRRGLSRWSPMILAKFEMFDLLDRYDSLVWFDVDMLVQAPVGDLWQAAPLAWRPLAEGAVLRRARVLGQLEDLILSHDIPLPNGGVVVAGRALRDNWGIGADDLYRMAAALLARTRATTLDELALFLLASNRSLPVKVLDPGLNHSVAQAGTATARILHAIGPDKFWNSAPLRQASPLWQADHDRWLAVGGSPAPAPERFADLHGLTPERALAQARNRAFWYALWQDLGPALPAGLWPDLRSEGPVLRLYLTGGDRRLWIELARAVSDQRLRVAAGQDIGHTAPAAGDALDRAMRAIGPGIRAQRRRRARLWSTELPLAEVAPMLATLRDRLVTAGAA